MSITISADDPRSIKAIEIAAEAGQWAKVTTRDGRQVFGIPSQRDPSHLYFVDLTSCTCEDFARNGLSEFRVGMSGEHGLCKHIRAVKLHHELIEATQDRTKGGRRRHLNLVPKQATEALATRYSQIFDDDPPTRRAVLKEEF